MKLFNTLSKKLIAAAITVAAVAGISTMAIAGFGPDRPTKDWSKDPTGFSYVTYNSFVNIEGKGDERDFLEGVQVGRDANWQDPVNDITNDAEVEVKLYMHNNADTSLNASGVGVAKNVTARVDIPSGLSAAKDIKGYISASNAQPVTVTDTLSFTGIDGSLFEFEPVIGSGKIYENGTVTGAIDVAQLLAGGVTLPNQNGCSEFVREITFRLKVKKPGYQVRKSARLAGETKDDWRENVNAKVGDKIEWRIFFQNIGSLPLSNVGIVDNLPPFMTVVPGTVRVVRGSAGDTYTYPDSAIQNDGKQINVNIGETYAPQAGAYLYFSTTINSDEKLSCGNISLQNVAYATPQGLGTINDGAFVTVVTGKTCEEPKNPVYTCDDVKIDILAGRKIKATVNYNGTPTDRVKLVNIEYNFGDGSTPLVTTNNPVEYTYAKDGTYNITAKVTFAVDGVNNTITSAGCAEVVTFTPNTTDKCPYNKNLAKNDPKCTKPSTLPNTGAGSMIGLFGAITAAGMFITRRMALRK